MDVIVVVRTEPGEEPMIDTVIGPFSAGDQPLAYIDTYDLTSISDELSWHIMGLTDPEHFAEAVASGRMK